MFQMLTIDFRSNNNFCNFFKKMHNLLDLRKRLHTSQLFIAAHAFGPLVRGRGSPYGVFSSDTDFGGLSSGHHVNPHV